VYDPDETFASKVNYELVDLEPLENSDLDFLRTTIADHVEETESAVGHRVLDGWEAEVSHFRKVMPRDYKRVLGVLASASDKGWSEEETLRHVMEVSNG
jgi:glutamate synthase (NADPH/NADH) large chain